MNVSGEVVCESVNCLWALCARGKVVLHAYLGCHDVAELGLLASVSFGVGLQHSDWSLHHLAADWLIGRDTGAAARCWGLYAVYVI